MYEKNAVSLNPLLLCPANLISENNASAAQSGPFNSSGSSFIQEGAPKKLNLRIKPIPTSSSLFCLWTWRYNLNSKIFFITHAPREHSLDAAAPFENMVFVAAVICSTRQQFVPLPASSPHSISARRTSWKSAWRRTNKQSCLVYKPTSTDTKRPSLKRWKRTN